MTVLDYLKNERQAWLEAGYNKDVCYEDTVRKQYVEALIRDIEEQISYGNIQ